MTKIFIIGYMGSGKSTLGRNLAKIFAGFTFTDLDQYIQENEQLTINEIFEQFGETKFRSLEEKYLKQLINCKQNQIIALGGGTPCFNGIMDIINHCGITIYLKHPTGQLAERLIKSPTPRPLIAGKELPELKKFIEKTLLEREKYYCLAQITAQSPSRNDLNSLEQIITLHPNWKP